MADKGLSASCVVNLYLIRHTTQLILRLDSGQESADVHKVVFREFLLFNFSQWNGGTPSPTESKISPSISEISQCI